MALANRGRANARHCGAHSRSGDGCGTIGLRRTAREHGPVLCQPDVLQQLNCSDLSDEAVRVDGALTQASQQQERAHGNDVVGVLLIGVTLLTLSGTNVAPQVASLKGQQQATHLAMVQKRCRVMAASPRGDNRTSLQDMNAAARRDEVAAKIAPAEIEEAQRLAREWRPEP
jgi:hypothetical protein